MSTALLLALLAAAPDPATPVTVEGIGALRIGLPVSALRRMGARPGETPETPGACHYWGFPGQDRIGLMVIGNRLMRIDIYDPAYRTRSGARVGMTEARIRRIYGPAMRVRPHPYTYPDGHYLIYHPAGHGHGLIVETDPDTRRAEMMRVGYWPQVQYIEGCQ
jgi:hypothetical protein